MPSLGPIASLQSSDSSLSSCSDISSDGTFYDRPYMDDSSTDSSLEDSSIKGHLDDSNLVFKLNGFHENLIRQHTRENVDSFEIVREVKTTEIPQNTNVERVSSDLEGSVLSIPNDEGNAEFWLPPEPEDCEDDMIGSVASCEDDDECGDGVSWGRPSSLCSFEEGSSSFKSKEEKLKVMNEIKNGKFMVFVSQLVKSVGLISSGDHDENWADILTSLSWEAAAFVKPNTNEGKAMDPDGYVKIKCIATGLRSQSQVIKGLVFKKHAAHKHMPTKYKNPRLLLIGGSLDPSSDGLSSFNSMKQKENSNLKTIVEMIDSCHPNVILVEKSVSRDIQESILSKGMTLVVDMKLHRLERVSRCIGSPILTVELATGQKLAQCESFHIDRFVEEHDVCNEGGKKPSKTLMFLEGCPSRLGCTIVLMGASSNELKRIKYVIRCAVFMAYHFMLETSFLLDQSAMFSTISPGEVVDLADSNKKSTLIGSVETNISDQRGFNAEMNTPFTSDIPISNGFHQNEPENLMSSSDSETSSSSSSQSFYPETFPELSLPTSIQKVMDDSFPLFSDSVESIASPLSYYGRNQDDQAANETRISIAPEAPFHHNDRQKHGYMVENLLDNEQKYQPEFSDTWNSGDNAEDHLPSKDEICAVLDSESILVLMSSRNASRGTICEQSHFSHIKFYRSFDIPLGKFLHDNLLNQKLQCKTCGESPEVHFFYYAHHNKQLTIQVRHLPARKCLPGETEGKLWMWSRCSLCQDGSSKSTKRVLISTAARGLSFGKFLELNFSDNPSFNRPSSCGHSFHKDFLYFFGLGPMVAMFKYSPVATYSLSLPPHKMEFSASIKREFLKKDSDDLCTPNIFIIYKLITSTISQSIILIDNFFFLLLQVYLQGISMFLDIEKSLKEIETRYIGVTLNIQGSIMEFSDIMLMLKQEKSQFEIDIQNAVKDESEVDSACRLLSLNMIRLELLLESCIWDRRLHALLSSDLEVINIDSTSSVLTEANECPVKEIHIDSQVEGSTPDVANNALNELLTVHTIGDETMPVGKTIEDAGSDAHHDQRGKPHLSSLLNLERDKNWIWAPISEIRREYIEDLQKGYLPKIESFSSYTAESMAQKLINNEGSRLHIPLGANDYIVSDYEDEFSSIIACALTLLKDVELETEYLAENARKERGIDSKLSESSQPLTRVFSLTTSRWPSFGSSDSDGSHSPPSNLEESHSLSFDGMDLLDSTVSYSASHLEVSMGLGRKRKYSVVCLFASQFRQLRERCCPSEVDYIASLSRCRNWDAKGGKSKSLFAKTLDDRLIIKEIQRTELDSFMKFASNYFEYMNECYELGNQTCLAKILGIYQVVIRATKNGKETRHDLLVMENLSFGWHITKQYDLKGALHARLSSSEAGEVLLDQNFVNDMNVSPLYVSRKSKRNLQRAVYNDTNFLNSINVMDYSLLVGVDAQRRQLVCGIIDYLRQYTWDKQLENWVKSSLVVPKNQLPTVISPIEYKKRFRKFISTHFLTVPDHWCSHRSSNPCKLCSPASENSSLQTKRHGSRDNTPCQTTSQKQGIHEAGTTLKLESFA